MRLGPYPLPREVWQEVFANLRAQGLTDAEIAEVQGHTEAWVWQVRTGYLDRPDVRARRAQRARERRARTREEAR